MPAYVVAAVSVTDPEGMAAYGARVSAVTEAHGGRYLFVGPGAEKLEGDPTVDGMAIIEFPDQEAARRWYDSPEYTELREVRKGNSMTLTLTPDV